MSVASHLGIKLTAYDARIRTFIPDYDEMLDVAALEVWLGPVNRLGSGRNVRRRDRRPRSGFQRSRSIPIGLTRRPSPPRPVAFQPNPSFDPDKIQNCRR